MAELWEQMDRLNYYNSDAVCMVLLRMMFVESVNIFERKY